MVERGGQAGVWDPGLIVTSWLVVYAASRFVGMRVDAHPERNVPASLRSSCDEPGSIDQVVGGPRPNAPGLDPDIRNPYEPLTVPIIELGHTVSTPS